MPTSAHRITFPIAAVVREGTREILRTLPPGCVVTLTSETDCGGMIEGICDGQQVRVFQRDLEERARRVELEAKTG